MILAILQARYTSTRLPGKVLKPILGRPMLSLQIERIKRSRKIDQLIVATSTEGSDNGIEALCHDMKVPCYRGSLDNVLDRFYQSSLKYKPDHIIRLTGDCPLIDPQVIDDVIDYYLTGGFDYATNALEPTFPDGLDVEVFRFSSLERAWREAFLPSQLEHVTPFIRNPEQFQMGHYKTATDLSNLRWTVDEPEDFELVRQVYERLYPDNPAFTTQDILALLSQYSSMSDINSHIGRNEGAIKSMEADKVFLKKNKNTTAVCVKDDYSTRYKISHEMLLRALEVIPLGSQTFSKSKTQYPVGVSPYFIKRGNGSHVWDVDGNEYIDFVNALCAITLGYNDADVTRAVKAQLEEGTIFSLPHEIEVDVAEKIVEMVPCAEMVRFGKNGSDATSGAIRLARAYTKRDHVAVCGYHGWQDWYIGSTSRNLGVPQSTMDLTHVFTYNDIDSLNRIFLEYPAQIAAVIMEPMNTTEPKDGFLEAVRELTHRHGAVFIFDETVTGFRFSNGGAQEYFGVTPDLATFGKGLANGYPVSAVTGKAEIMRLMEEVFFSFTYGGETLSLTAALATMTKLQKEPVIEKLWSQGRKVVVGTNLLIESHGLEDVLSIGGKECWSFLLFKDSDIYSQWELKTLFLQEVFIRGILVLGTHNMSYAHTDEDITRLLVVYDEVFALIKDTLVKKDLKQRLQSEALVPLFKIR